MYIVITTMGTLRHAHNIEAVAFILGKQLTGNGVKLSYG